MRIPPLLVDFIHSSDCKLICEKSLTLPIHEEVLDAAVQEFAQTMRVKMAKEQKELKQKQKMWALRKPILDAHILLLQKRIQELEQQVDEIIIEKINSNHYSGH